MTQNARTRFPLSLLSQDEKELFYEQGFFVLRNLFNEADLQVMRLACQRLTSLGLRHQDAAYSSVTTATDKHIHYEENAKFVYRRGASGTLALSHLVGCGTLAPELNAYLRSTPLVHTFSNLLGHDQLQHLLCQFHPKLPGSGIVFKPHRDIQHRINYAERCGANWNDVNGEGSYIVGIVAVDSMDRSNGGLCALAGSHRPRVNLHNDELTQVDSQELSQHPDFRALTLSAGDAVFLHPYLLHWSDQNTHIAKTRYTLITGYCVAGANPNQNPLDYAGDSTKYMVQTTPEGFTLNTPSWQNCEPITSLAAPNGYP